MFVGFKLSLRTRAMTLYLSTISKENLSYTFRKGGAQLRVIGTGTAQQSLAVQLLPNVQ